MAVKLRLQRKGRKAAPFYHIVVADSRFPRDGRFIEKIGTYNPLTVPATIELNRDRAYDWLVNGAQPSDTVRAILRFKGVMYRKHLEEGVKKGAITREQADEKLAKWIEQTEARIAARREDTAEKKRKFSAAVDGMAKVKAKPAPAPVETVEEAAPAAEENVEAAETAAEAAEAPAAEVEAAAETAEEAVAAAEETVAEEAVAAVEETVAEETAPEEAAPEAEAVAEETAPGSEEEKSEDA